MAHGLSAVREQRAARLRRALRRRRARRAAVRLPPLRRERRRAAPAAGHRPPARRLARRGRLARGRAIERVALFGSSFAGGHVWRSRDRPGNRRDRLPVPDDRRPPGHVAGAAKLTAAQAGEGRGAGRRSARCSGASPKLMPAVGRARQIALMIAPGLGARLRRRCAAGLDVAQRGRRRAWGCASRSTGPGRQAAQIAVPAAGVRVRQRHARVRRSGREGRRRTRRGASRAATRSATSRSIWASGSSAPSPTRPSS